jgi:hypothetical protein
MQVLQAGVWRHGSDSQHRPEKEVLPQALRRKVEHHLDLTNINLRDLPI